MKRLYITVMEDICNDNDYAVMFRVAAGNTCIAEYVFANSQVFRGIGKKWDSSVIRCEMKVDTMKEFKAYEHGLGLATELSRELER